MLLNYYPIISFISFVIVLPQVYHLLHDEYAHEVRAETGMPTELPTWGSITSSPSRNPTRRPTKSPTSKPSRSPTTRNPTSMTPTTAYPTAGSASNEPLSSPTFSPSNAPTTINPTTTNPSKSPIIPITSFPTTFGTQYPTKNPISPSTSMPTKMPGDVPTIPTRKPISSPSQDPISPTISPTISTAVGSFSFSVAIGVGIPLSMIFLSLMIFMYRKFPRKTQDSRLGKVEMAVAVENNDDNFNQSPVLALPAASVLIKSKYAGCISHVNDETGILCSIILEQSVALLKKRKIRNVTQCIDLWQVINVLDIPDKIHESKCLIGLLSKSYFTQSRCLISLHFALEYSLPILFINVVSAGYNADEINEYLLNLSVESFKKVNKDGYQEIQAMGIDINLLGMKIYEAICNSDVDQYDPSAPQRIREAQIEVLFDKLESQIRNG